MQSYHPSGLDGASGATYGAPGSSSGYPSSVQQQQQPPPHPQPTRSGTESSVNMDDSILSAGAAAFGSAGEGGPASAIPTGGLADEGDAESAVEGQPPAKRRRNRRPISCKNCRRRKLKCDRGNPCGSCRDRNEADQCSWDDAIRVPPETSTRGVEALELRSQLDRLEGLLGALMGGNEGALRNGDAASNFSAAPNHAHLADLAVATRSPISPVDAIGSYPNSAPSFPGSLLLPRTALGSSSSDPYTRLASALPSSAELHDLLLFFQSHIMYLLPIAHFPTLQKRVFEFDRAPSSAKTRGPALLALLLAIAGIAKTAKGTQAEYAGALTGYTGFQVTDERCSPADGKVGASMTAGKALVEASVEALHLANYMANPTLDCVRTMILLNHYHRFDPSTKAMLILSEALTLARAMDLNRDPSREGGAALNRIEVEERRRLWALLRAAEASQGAGRGLTVAPSEFDTELPANADDNDVTPTTVKVLPMTTVTDTTPLLVLVQVGELTRRIYREVYSISARPTYQTILDLNNDLEKLTNSLPPALSFPWNATGTGVVVPRSTAAGKEWFRFILHLSLRGLYIRLHHPFLIRGYIDDRFEFNRDSCLAAARFTLACHRGLAEDARALSCRFVIADACNALFILAVDLFQDPTGKNAAAHRSDIAGSTALLRHCETAEGELVSHTLKVVAELVNRAANGGSAKRKRDGNAALDPALVYGNGFTSTGGSSGASRPTLPPQPPLDRAAPFSRPLPLSMSSEAWRPRDSSSSPSDPLLDIWDGVAKMPMYAVPDRRAWKELVDGTFFASGLDILRP